jgi:hypothetical protein
MYIEIQKKQKKKSQKIGEPNELKDFGNNKTKESKSVTVNYG